MNNGRSPGGSGSRAPHEAAKASSPKASIPNAAKWLLLYEDNSERLEVSYDLASYWTTDVLIKTNDSSDWQVRIDAEDLRWLSERLIDAASAIEARRAETVKHGSVGDESAIPQGDAQNPEPNNG